MDFDAKKVYRLMVKTRCLEERLIKMAKSSDGYFWIGGPGEEAFNVPLGLLIQKGQGPAYDYLHFHYRNSGTLTAMGMDMIDAIRQMGSKATDPFSGGRNFVSHFARKDWNVFTVHSPIATQYSIAPGTARAQLKEGGDGITIVTGGDAGTAEGDFATCLNWSSRPGEELPILIIVTNNRYGISTPFDQVHSDEIIARRAESFGIKWDTVDGNDPVASYHTLKAVMNYVRTERKPFCLEAYVSRLHGHSSSSGGNRVQGEKDCIQTFEKKLISEGVLDKNAIRDIRQEYELEALSALKTVREEPDPDPDSVYDHVFVDPPARLTKTEGA